MEEPQEAIPHHHRLGSICPGLIRIRLLHNPPEN